MVRRVFASLFALSAALSLLLAAASAVIWIRSHGRCDSFSYHGWSYRPRQVLSSYMHLSSGRGGLSLELSREWREESERHEDRPDEWLSHCAFDHVERPDAKAPIDWFSDTDIHKWRQFGWSASSDASPEYHSRTRRWIWYFPCWSVVVATGALPVAWPLWRWWRRGRSGMRGLGLTRPWVLSLLLAGALGALWTRSYFRQDEIELPSGPGNHHYVGSRCGLVVCGVAIDRPDEVQGSWYVLRVGPLPGFLFGNFRQDTALGFGLAHYGWSYQTPPNKAVVGVAYLVRFPLWVAIAMLSILPARRLALFVRGRHRLRVRRQRGLCLTCGYDLRAHSPGQRCPECGSVIGEAATKR